MKKRVLLTVGLGLLLVFAIAGTALAQGGQPPATPKTTDPAPLAGQALAKARAALVGKFGGWETFDVIAKTLNLTPAVLFEKLHSGKTLPEIAKAQGVEMKAIQAAIKAQRDVQAKANIQKMLEKGKITQDQANWMLKGLENGWRWPPARLPKQR